MKTFLFLVSMLGASASSAIAQELSYPEGAAIPRSLTPAEASYIALNPLGGPHNATAPPSGQIYCASEYEPMDGIIIAWEGSNSWTTILAQMAAQITTIGDADVFVAVDSTNEQNSASSKISGEGANMSRVNFMVVNTDTIWMRDYGPRYIFQGDVRAIVDHTYNRPRPQDNAFPTYFSGYTGHSRYEHQLTHGGGNFHLDSTGLSYTTRLINNENGSLTEQEIHDIWQIYQDVDTYFFDPLPASIDSTQHLDMWMQIAADDVVVISDWPAQQGSTQDQICDAAAVTMANRGYNVFRIPARKTGGFFGTHYTYTNVVMCNDLVLVPLYTNSTITQYNSQALAAWQAACPNKTIVQINAEAIVSAAGVLHCIVMHLPRHRGGVNPTAYLTAPAGGECLTPGEQVSVTWISDDDVAATSADLLLSTDGGQTFPTTIATGLAASGTYNWTVPGTLSDDVRIRVVVYDGSGNTGSHDGDWAFSIANANDATLGQYGEGKVGSNGIPVLSSQTLPILGSSATVQLSNARANAPAKLIRGSAMDSVLFDNTYILVNYDTIFDLTTDGSGNASLTATVPNNANLAGYTLYWQAWIPNDPAANGQQWASSNGLKTRLGF